MQYFSSQSVQNHRYTDSRANIEQTPLPYSALVGLITTPFTVCRVFRISRFCFADNRCFFAINCAILSCGIMKPPVLTPCPYILSMPALQRLLKAPVARPGNILEIAREAIRNTFAAIDDQSATFLRYSRDVIF